MQGAKIHGCEAHGAGRVRYKIKKVSMDHKALEDLVIRFTEAFNQNDLEGVMALMAENAVYEEFTGTINRGKALIRWVCRLETKRGPAGWRGLDILHVENGLVTQKLTYAKAKVPLLE